MTARSGPQPEATSRRRFLAAAGTAAAVPAAAALIGVRPLAGTARAATPGMARHVTASTRVVDAVGRRVIPGLIDSHMHVIRTGLHYLLELRWDGIRSLRQALAMLREQASRTPDGQWVRVVGGWIGKAPVLDEPGQLESTRHFLHELNRFGLTSAIDAAGGFQSFPEHYAAVTRLAEQAALSVRLAYHLFPRCLGRNWMTCGADCQRAAGRQG